MKTSLKRIFRTPVRALLLFLLAAASTALLTVSAVSYTESAGRIQAMESQFTTIGRVEQLSTGMEYDIVENSCIGKHTNVYRTYGEIVPPDSLLFEGAHYLREPESRRYYLAYLPELINLRSGSKRFRDLIIFTFTALEDSDGTEPVRAQVRSVLLNELDFNQVHLEDEKHISEGEEVVVCQHFAGVLTPLRKGDTYIASVAKRYCDKHSAWEFAACQGPYSSECDQNGNPVLGEAASFPAMTKENGGCGYRIRTDVISEIPDYKNPARPIEKIDPSKQLPEKWTFYIIDRRELAANFPVLGTNSTDLLPTFHNGNAYIAQGRNITEEEFETGAGVCLIPQEWVAADAWFSSEELLGSQLNLGLFCTLSGFAPERSVYGGGSIQERYSMLDADGDKYTPFFYKGYQVVGTYSLRRTGVRVTGKTELMQDLIIIPQRSVTEEDANFAYFAPMNSYTTSFQIENGTAEQFDKAFHDAVPEAERLKITYEDNGYADLKASLLDLERSAVLLFLTGICAAAGMAVLLLYFFVVRQKREVAIARSMGGSKRQCRGLVLKGVLVLAAAACILGSCAGTLLLETSAPFDLKREQSVVQDGGTGSRYMGYDIAYSAWAKELDDPKLAEDDPAKPVLISIFVPLCEFLLVWGSSLLLVNRYVKADPILLLSQKPE